MLSRTPHACTAGPQQRDGGAHACYKENPSSGEACAIVTDLRQSRGPGTPRIIESVMRIAY